jgi:hypothetical protein
MTPAPARTLATLLALVCAPAAAADAQTLTQTAPPAARPPVWEVTAGVRTAFIKSAGFDPFSTDDGLVQFSATGSRVLLQAGRLSLAAGLGLDVGGSSATARGAPSSLSLTRVSALAEGRYQPLERLYLFARLAPGLLHGSASIDDHTSPNTSPLTDSFDSFALDATGGAALRLAALGRARVGAWLVADGGYGWAPSQHLVLAPALGADQSKAGALDLGSLAPRGAFFRISAALGF